MKKNHYVAPATTVISMKMTSMLCDSVRGAGAASDIGWGGKASNYSGEAGGRSGGWDDDE